MGHAKTVKNAAPGKKEKIFHPQSRKADQIARSNLRKDKLQAAGSKRRKRDAAVVNIYTFFYHALPPTDGTLSLKEIHDIVHNAWLSRHDIELDAERGERKAGRPKSARQMLLEEVKLREAEEYRSGLEVLDLTHPDNVELFRQWDQTEAAYVEMLRFIRISSAQPEVVIVSRPGKHVTLNPDWTGAQAKAGQEKRAKAKVIVGMEMQGKAPGSHLLGDTSMDMDEDGEEVPELIQTK